MALRHQNAELDYEIASVLSHQVCQPLDDQIEQLSVMVSDLVSMNAQLHLPALCDSARRMLPGVLHAQAHLDIAVKVLTYFGSHAQQELSTGVRPTLCSTDPALLEGAKQMQSLFSAYCRIHQPPK